MDLRNLRQNKGRHLIANTSHFERWSQRKKNAEKKRGRVVKRIDSEVTGGEEKKKRQTFISSPAQAGGSDNRIQTPKDSHQGEKRNALKKGELRQLR